jgi:hypothetical protein
VRPVAAWIRTVALISAAFLIGFGLWAFLAPQSFFDQLAAFEPYNVHFLHDIGAFQVGLGAVLGLAAFPVRIDGLAAALLGVGTGALLHAIAHVRDSGLGGTPTTDIPTFTVLALVLLAAGFARQRA